MNDDEFIRQRIVNDFEDQLDSRIKRVKKIRLQNIIPYHWFASAASDCAGMYVSEYYYGCISISQAYVEALSNYLCEYHKVKMSGDIKRRWNTLCEAHLITPGTRDAALAVFEDRNDFHHLNKSITDEKMELEKRAEECLAGLTTIESEVFGYSYSDSEPGKHILHKPEYWPSSGPEMVQASIRTLW